MADETISGRVARVLFNKGDFYILNLEVSRKTLPISARGNIHGLIKLRRGVPISLVGDWGQHDKYGKQLVIKSWCPWAETENDVEEFLNVCIEGFLDRDLAEAVASAFGTQSFDKLTTYPSEVQDKLPQEFLGPIASGILGWQQALATRDLGELMGEGGFSPYDIQSAIFKFGAEAPQIIKTNPYRLMEIIGFSFLKVDKFAPIINIGSDDPKRLAGAILWTLQDQLSEGHLFIESKEIQDKISSLFLKHSLRMFKIPDMASVIPRVVEVLERRKALVSTEDGIYLPELHAYESESAEILAERLAPSPLDVDYLTFLSNFERRNSIELAEAQRTAIFQLLQHRIFVLTGTPGSGKCVKADTIVSGTFGFKEIGDFLPETLEKDATSTFRVSLDTSVGPAKAAYIYNGGVTDTIKLVTKRGYTLEGTPEHPIRVVREGEIVWCKLGEISVGEPVVLVKNPELYTFGNNLKLPQLDYLDAREAKIQKTPDRVTPALSTIMGFLTSEGSVVNRSSWVISAFDEVIVEKLEQLFMESFNYHIRRYVNRGRLEGCRFFSVPLVRWFRKLGVKPEYAAAKSIPSAILETSRENVRAYLQALFEGDGSVNTKRLTIEYGTASPKLATQLQTLLLAFGVVTGRHECVRGGNPYFRLSISGEDYDQFRASIGFYITPLPARSNRTNTNKHLIYASSSLIRSAILEIQPSGHYRQFYRYTVEDKDYKRRPSKVQLRRLLSYAKMPTPSTVKLGKLLDEGLFFDPVKTLTEGYCQVVDFGVPKTHEFISAGFISHNTTAVKALVSLLQEARHSFALMAPTGIAAKRLAFVTGCQATTVHRALRYDGVAWGHNGGNHLPVDAVIFDEVSMCDQELLYRLLTALRPEAILVLVGDDAQLPSVGPGNVLRELIGCSAIPKVRLTQIFRQSEKGEIVTNAHRILKGEMPLLVDPKTDTEFKFLKVSDEQRIVSMIVDLAHKLKSKNANFQILSPRYEGAVGVNALNEALRERLNPPGPREWSKDDLNFRIGDRLMVVKNDYQRGVYNGDVGKFVDITKDGLVVKVHGIGPNDPDTEVVFDTYAAMERLRLAYAVTVHRCQGSEFDTIIMPITRTQGRMLQRNLLYTAITRAKKKVYLIGDEAAISFAVQNDKVVHRNTVLGKLICEDAGVGDHK